MYEATQYNIMQSLFHMNITQFARLVDGLNFCFVLGKPITRAMKSHKIFPKMRFVSGKIKLKYLVYSVCQTRMLTFL